MLFISGNLQEWTLASRMWVAAQMTVIATFCLFCYFILYCWKRRRISALGYFYPLSLCSFCGFAHWCSSEVGYWNWVDPSRQFLWPKSSGCCKHHLGFSMSPLHMAEQIEWLMPQEPSSLSSNVHMSKPPLHAHIKSILAISWKRGASVPSKPEQCIK